MLRQPAVLPATTRFRPRSDPGPYLPILGEFNRGGLPTCAFRLNAGIVKLVTTVYIFAEI
jgi:hypothetical protein